jgi:NTE family protein
VGLALGGGVVRGWAHTGVLQVLEAAGVPVHLAAGVSAGAIVGALFCAGQTASEALRFAGCFTWRRLARPVWPWRGLVSFTGLRALLESELGAIDLADLPTPLTVVTTDVDRGEPVYLRSGPLAPAVQASCSVPGFVEPVQIEARRLCEGGVAEMLPARAVRQMGADYVIGVDIFAFKLRRWLGPLGYGLNGLEIALERTGGGIDQADCLIAPELAGETYLRFSRRERLAAAGRRAALLKLPDICRDLGLPYDPQQVERRLAANGAPALPQPAGPFPA